MVQRGGDEWVAPVTRLFGAPAPLPAPGQMPGAAPSTPSAGSEEWFVPEGEIEPDETVAAVESLPVERKLPTFADFDRGSRNEQPTSGVVEARDRFGARRRAHDPDATDDTSGVEESPRRRIENVSTAALARRGLSESEVRSRLIDKGFTAEQVEPEMERLIAAGYLDDRKLADEIIRVEAERKGKGRSAIVAELKRRGVDAESFGDAIAELDPDDEFDRAQELVRRKLSSLRNVDDETAKRRLYGALARRGFGGDVVRSVIDQAMIDRP